MASHSFTVEWSTPSGLTVVSPNNSTNRLHTFQSKKTNNTTKLALNVTGLSYQDEGRYDCIVETLSTTLQAEAQLELLSTLSWFWWSKFNGYGFRLERALSDAISNWERAVIYFPFSTKNRGPWYFSKTCPK